MLGWSVGQLLSCPAGRRPSAGYVEVKRISSGHRLAVYSATLLSLYIITSATGRPQGSQAQVWQRVQLPVLADWRLQSALTRAKRHQPFCAQRSAWSYGGPFRDTKSPPESITPGPAYGQVHPHPPPTLTRPLYSPFAAASSAPVRAHARARCLVAARSQRLAFRDVSLRGLCRL